MNESVLPFGPGGLAVMSVFVFGMLGIGWMAYRARREDTLEDFYLAGRNMSFWVLLLTLYATQYSGNTLLGFSGAAYRTGFHFLVSTHFMTAIVTAYLFFAPALYRLSREHRFITPGDFIYHRYQSHALRIVVSVLMIYALCNFTAAQLKTLGTAFAGVSQGRVPMWAGVVGMLLVMLIYESMGGLRSVAWTDVVQGGLLFVGFIILIGVALTQIGDLPSAVSKLASNPATRFKVEPPELSAAPHWISFVLMVGLGGAIYPQAIQRVYCAANVRVLKRSLAVMAFMPLVTTVISITVGVLMAAHRPILDMPDSASRAIALSETALSALCHEIMMKSDLGYWLVVIIFSAIIAAVMSTADSALLSIGSMVTQDLYGQYIRPGSSQDHLTRVGGWATWMLMIPVTWTALWYEGNLIQLLQLKFELLVQCVPAIYLGVHWKQLRGETVLAGIVAGLAVTLALAFSSVGSSGFWGIHSGMIGLAVNLLVCLSDLFRKEPHS